MNKKAPVFACLIENVHVENCYNVLNCYDLFNFNLIAIWDHVFCSYCVTWPWRLCCYCDGLTGVLSSWIMSKSFKTSLCFVLSSSYNPVDGRCFLLCPSLPWCILFTLNQTGQLGNMFKFLCTDWVLIISNFWRI